MFTTDSTDIQHHLNTLTGVKLSLSGDFGPNIHAVFLDDAIVPPFLDVLLISMLPPLATPSATVKAGYVRKQKFYFFSSTILDVKGGCLLLCLPDKIGITQRRKHFREQPLESLSALNLYPQQYACLINAIALQYGISVREECVSRARRLLCLRKLYDSFA